MERIPVSTISELNILLDKALDQINISLYQYKILRSKELKQMNLDRILDTSEKEEEETIGRKVRLRNKFQRVLKKIKKKNKKNKIL